MQWLLFVALKCAFGIAERPVVRMFQTLSGNREGR